MSLSEELRPCMMVLSHLFVLLGCHKITTHKDNTMCSGNASCTSFQCCVGLDIKVSKVMVKPWIIWDPCSFVFRIRLGDLSFDVSLFSYKWEERRNMHISDFLTIR